jgi:hypothetical protein
MGGDWSRRTYRIRHGARRPSVPTRCRRPPGCRRAPGRSLSLERRGAVGRQLSRRAPARRSRPITRQNGELQRPKGLAISVSHLGSARLPAVLSLGTSMCISTPFTLLWLLALPRGCVGQRARSPELRSTHSPALIRPHRPRADPSSVGESSANQKVEPCSSSVTIRCATWTSEGSGRRNQHEVSRRWFSASRHCS